MCRGEWGESVLTETILDYCSEELETRGGREPGLNPYHTLVLYSDFWDWVKVARRCITLLEIIRERCCKIIFDHPAKHQLTNMAATSSDIISCIGCISIADVLAST